MQLCVWKVQCLLGVCKYVSDAGGEEEGERCVGKGENIQRKETA